MIKIMENLDMIMETSWEVCNKVGGIYTVISTKAAELQALAAEKPVVFFGPDVWRRDSKPCDDFIEDDTLLNSFSKVADLPMGVKVRTGRWNIPSEPIAVLVGFDGVFEHLDGIYGRMWNSFGVDSLHAYGDYDEGCAFAVAVAIAMKGLTEHLGIDPAKTLAHFNEWTTGMGLLYLRLEQPETASVFTTHATSIGRSICSNGKPLYDYFEGYHGNQMACELNMESKHSLERAAAHAADCFTTVSEVTARECEQLLDIRPDVVTPNGFERRFVPAVMKQVSLRKKGRATLLDVASKVLGREFPKDTFIVATSGRGEFRNKGIDLFIDAVERLPKEGRTVLAFIFTPGWVNLEAPIPGDGFKTHGLHNENQDPIANRLRVHSQTDATPIIYVPCYLDGKDGVIDIPYYDLLPAIDMTVFPSYYEPWGYTPLESIAFRVPTLTTDKAGFGQWILDNYPNSFAACGVEVIVRTDSNYDSACAETCARIETLRLASEAEMKKIRTKASITSATASWRLFISRYSKAFKIALGHAAARMEANK